MKAHESLADPSSAHPRKMETCRMAMVQCWSSGLSHRPLPEVYKKIQEADRSRESSVESWTKGGYHHTQNARTNKHFCQMDCLTDWNNRAVVLFCCTAANHSCLIFFHPRFCQLKQCSAHARFPGQLPHLMLVACSGYDPWKTYTPYDSVRLVNLWDYGLPIRALAIFFC